MDLVDSTTLFLDLAECAGRSVGGSLGGLVERSAVGKSIDSFRIDVLT